MVFDLNGLFIIYVHTCADVSLDKLQARDFQDQLKILGLFEVVLRTYASSFFKANLHRSVHRILDALWLHIVSIGNCEDLGGVAVSGDDN